jgi:peptidyl-prolyl cis-trans isomerase B (cyclophilin B)
VRILIILVALMLFTPVSKAESSPMVESFEGNPIIVINLTYEAGTGGGSDFDGEIVLELFLNWAPITVENFVSLVEQGFYDGIFFHRIIDDFVIQSGDPTCKEVVAYPVTDPTCGDNGSDDNIPFESNENLTHINGAIGMARGLDPDSATSQFYICDTPQHGLDNGNRTQEDDPGYAVFGVVREGLDLVQLAAGVPTTNDVDGDGSTPRAPGGPDRPLYEVHINSITLREYVTIPVVEKEEEGLPSFNLNLAILSMVLVSILRRN